MAANQGGSRTRKYASLLMSERAKNGVLLAKIKALEEQVGKDHLTGLPNRLVFCQVMKRESERAIRTKDKKLAVVFLDIDFFKRINDTYGHPAGDAVLVKLGEILKSFGRASDVACRVGGEEFAIIMPDTPLDGALTFLESLRDEVQETLHLVLAEQGCVNTSPITLSIGITMFKPDEDVEQALVRVDKILYQAKESGRNQICCAYA